jgi:hypothetical protein
LVGFKWINKEVLNTEKRDDKANQITKSESLAEQAFHILFNTQDFFNHPDKKS